MNQSKKRPITSLLAFLCFAVIVVFVVTSMTRISGDMDDKQIEIAENTIRRYAAQCYAVEGFFPEDLGYLEENYGLHLNIEKFVYHYVYVGSNILPEISIFLIESDK